MSTNIIIIGALGRMGLEIAKVVREDPDTALIGCVEYPGHPKIGADYYQCAGIDHGRDYGGLKVVSSIDDVNVNTNVNTNTKNNTVIIDFSSVQSTRSNLQRAAAVKLPMVIGTTGLEKADHDLARAASSSIPVLVSSNMSLGVNILFLLTELVAKKLGGAFDIEIIEAHHRLKKDSPSGTAKTLGEVAASALGLTYDEAVVNGRFGMIDGVRPAKEIGMHAVRGGGIVGDHTVLFAGADERLELRHMAHNRGIFARGAVFAAKWLAEEAAKPGLYTMRDVLGLS